MKLYAVMEINNGCCGGGCEAVIVCSTEEKAKQFVAMAVEQTGLMWAEMRAIPYPYNGAPDNASAHIAALREEYFAKQQAVRQKYRKIMGGFGGGIVFEIWPIGIDAVINRPSEAEA